MEMKAALKVLNDSIHRPQRGSSKLLVNAIEIVRREWVQVTFSFIAFLISFSGVNKSNNSLHTSPFLID